MEKTNIEKIAGYASSFVEACLEKGHGRVDLYEPRKEHFYTDASVKCQFPEFGPRAGYAVTMKVGLPVTGFDGPTRFDLMKVIDASPKPVTLVIQVDEPEELRNSDSNFGGNFGVLCHTLGVENLICNGAVRDIDELKEMGMQVMIPGTIAGTAPSVIYEINGTVEVAGMQVKAGDIVHMDNDGAVKFPGDMLDQVLLEVDIEQQAENELKEVVHGARNLEECINAYHVCHERCTPTLGKVK